MRLLIIGDAANAGDLERRLETRIAAETQIVPAVRVLAVPDAEALARATAVPEVVVPELAAVEEARSRLAGELTRAWPTAVSGLLAGWSLDLPPRGVPQVTVYHFGPRLGAAGEALLAGALAPALEVTPTIMDVPLDSMPIYSGRDPSEWFSFLSPSFALVPWLDQVIGCITQPATPTVDPAINSTADVADSVSALVARSEGRVDVAEGAGWAFAWTTGECRSPPASDNTVFVPGF